MANYSTILNPSLTTIIDSGSVFYTNSLLEETSNQIYDWITIDSRVANVGEVYYRSSGSWMLASISTDISSDAVGVIEQVTSTLSGSLAKLIYKGIIDFSQSDIILSDGLPYFLNDINYTTGSITSSNLIVNGGFETGDLTGWNSDGGNSVNSGDGGPHSGTYFLGGGSVGSMAFTYQFIPTVIGETYLLSYYFQSDGEAPSEFQVTVGNNIVLDLFDTPSYSYKQFTQSFQAVSSSTLIKFGIRNDPAYSLLDDVSVVSSTPINLASSGPINVCNTTTIEPLISKPIFVATSETTALVVNMRGHANNNQITPAFPIFPDIPCPTPIPPAPTASIFLYTFLGPCPPTNLTCSSQIGNELQIAYCYSGSISSSIPPNTFYGYTQEQANQAALAQAYLGLTCTAFPFVLSSYATTTTSSFFSYAITASEDPNRYSASNMPANLDIDPLTGIISGTLTEIEGFYNVELFASNNAGTGSNILTLTINP